MIKPILKIEMTNNIPVEDRDQIATTLQGSSAKDDYHIIIVYSDTEVTSIEIITAPDASIHKP